MSVDEKLIIVVPGFASREKDECLKRLTEGLTRFAALRGLTLQSVESPDAHIQYSYQYGSGGDKKYSLSFKEVFWNDLTPPLSERSPFKKFIGGLSILLFWTMSRRVLRVAWSNHYMFLSSVFAVLILLFWYYGAVIAALTAIGSLDDANPFANALPQSVRIWLSALGAKLAGWQIWLSASTLMALLPVNLVVDVAHSTKRYFRNDDDLARKLQTRIAVALNDAKGKNYTDIVVFAHSFGAVAAVESLAAFQSEVPIHLVTAGSPLAICCARSPDLERAVRDLLTNKDIRSWSDFYSNGDWMCCAPPVKGNFPHFKVTPIKFSTGFTEKFTGKAHMNYFNFNVLYKQILE
nr:hypothetical protein [uncultured Azospirillum sp.]